VHRFTIFAMTLVMLMGCEENQTGTESGNPPVVHLPKLGESTNSGTLEGCMSDDECMERANTDFLNILAQTHDDWTTYESSYCGRAEIDSDGVYHFGGENGEPSCLCVDETYSYIDGDLLTPTIESPCLIRGRYNQCIFYKDEFFGCDLTKTTKSCEPNCREVESRNQQDAQWQADNFSLRLAKCIVNPRDIQFNPDRPDRIGSCHYVFDADSECYAVGILFANVVDPLDCSMTDDELMNELQKDLSDDWPRNRYLPVIFDDAGNVDGGVGVGNNGIAW
jgi:hypothetical protein